MREILRKIVEELHSISASVRIVTDELSVTDRTNIFCFCILMIVSMICIVIAKKMKLPIWKFQIAWIVCMDIIGVVLLISRLQHG